MNFVTILRTQYGLRRGALQRSSSFPCYHSIRYSVNRKILRPAIMSTTIGRGLAAAILAAPQRPYAPLGALARSETRRRYRLYRRAGGVLFPLGTGGRGFPRRRSTRAIFYTGSPRERRAREEETPTKSTRRPQAADERGSHTP